MHLVSFSLVAFVDFVDKPTVRHSPNEFGFALS